MHSGMESGGPRGPCAQTFISWQQASCASIWCHCDLLQIAPEQLGANGIADFKRWSSLLSLIYDFLIKLRPRQSCGHFFIRITFLFS